VAPTRQGDVVPVSRPAAYTLMWGYYISVDVLFWSIYYYNREEETQRNLDNVLPDGYVVYKNDTIRGYIMVDKKDIYIKQFGGFGHDVERTFSTTNTDVTCVMLYNAEDKMMALVRLNAADRKLWRIVHEGKVNLYDDRIGFIYEPNDIDKDNLTIVCGGEVEHMKTFFGFDVKQSLIDDINHEYGAALNGKTSTWSQTLEFLDKQD
jgi:hypothetical protein